MDTHARGALAVCLLLAGCQSPLFPSFSWRNRLTDGPKVAASRPGGEAAVGRADVSDSRRPPVRPASFDRAAAPERRSAITGAMDQGREADARGQADLARYHYQRVLELEPGHTDAHHALAILADKQGDFRTAETHYMRALRTKPEDANLLSDIGYSYVLQGRRHDAEWYLREALKYDPRHAKANGNLELLFDEQKAFATLRQLLGDDVASSRIAALFPQSNRMVAAHSGRAASFRPDERPPAASAPQADYYQSQPAPPAQEWQHPAATAQMGPAPERTAMDSLREEMARERQMAFDARRQPVQHPLSAPPVEPDAFANAPHAAAGWPPADGHRHPQVTAQTAPSRFESDSHAAYAAPAPQVSPAQWPAQFQGEPSHAPPTPYGQWVVPAGATTRPSQAPALDGEPEPWPYSPADASTSRTSGSATQPTAASAAPATGTQPYGWPQSDGRFGQAFGQTADASARPQPFASRPPVTGASPDDVYRAARQIGMETGSLWPEHSQGNASTPRPQHPAYGPVVPAAAPAATPHTAWDYPGARYNPAGVRTADAWESQRTYPPAPAAHQPSPIVITPGTSSSTAGPPSPSASAWSSDHSTSPATHAPESYYPERVAAPSAGAGASWPQTGYSPGAGSTAAAGSASQPATWPGDPRTTGWNGQ